MIEIEMTELPVMGNLQRTCKACGDSYQGWNFVLCNSCEDSRRYVVVGL